MASKEFNPITKTINNKPFIFELNINNYATMGSGVAMETFSPPDSADVWQLKVTRAYFDKSLEDPSDPNLYLWFEIGFDLVSRADGKEEEDMSLFYKVDMTFNRCSWPTQQGHLVFTKYFKSYKSKFWSKSFKKDDFYQNYADIALNFALSLSYSSTNEKSSVLPKSSESQLNSQTKTFDNELFVFTLNVSNYSSMVKKYAEEHFSPPGSLDVWYLRVYRATFGRSNTESNPTDLNLYPHFVTEFGLVSRADGREEENETITASYQTEACIKGVAWDPKTGIKAFKKKTRHSEYYVNNNSTKEVFQSKEYLGIPLTFVVRLGYTPTPSSNTAIIERSLSYDLGQLAKHVDNLKLDVILRGSDGEVEVSSAVLIARSEVFRKTLKVDMIEKTTGLINLPEFKCDRLNAFVRFLLTDRIDDLDNLAVDLFILADKYQVTKLKAICEEHIAGQVNDQNAPRILALIEMIPSAKIMAQLMKVNNSNKN